MCESCTQRRRKHFTRAMLIYSFRHAGRQLHAHVRTVQMPSVAQKTHTCGRSRVLQMLTQDGQIWPQRTSTTMQALGWNAEAERLSKRVHSGGKSDGTSKSASSCRSWRFRAAFSAASCATTAV